MLKKNLFNFYLITILLLGLMFSCGGNKIQSDFPPREEFTVSPFNPSPIHLVTHPGEIVKFEYDVTEFIARGWDLKGKNLRCETSFFPIFLQGAKLQVFLGIDYYSSPRIIDCFLESVMIGSIEVKEKEYPKETLQVDNKRVVLSAVDLARVKEEEKILKKIYEEYINYPLYEGSFLPPLQSKITSFYGTRRVFNGTLKSAHLGTDFRAAVGVEIPSTNAGIVVYAGELFYTGNTVIVNHGLGIFSIYGHLSEILLKKGDKVKKMQILGRSGATGRVSGPHLHWGVKVSNFWVDGLSLVSLSH